MTAEEEAEFVTGADLGDRHPDNVSGDVDDADFGEDHPGTADEDDDTPPSDEELDSLVADVDADDVDTVGFDDADLEEPTTTGTPGSSPTEGS